ncbi:hypothetical protein Hanom_Chr05g00457481 [Helianthus anomalus]
MTSYGGGVDSVLINEHPWLTDSTEVKTTAIRVSSDIFFGESSVSLFSFACRFFTKIGVFEGKVPVP